MKLLVGIATAAAFHALVLGVGMALLPRQATPAPAPAQVDVDVVATRPEPLDRPPVAAPPAPPPRTHLPPRRAQARPQSFAMPAAAMPDPVLAAAPPQSSAAASVPVREAIAAPGADVTPAQPQYRSNPAPEYPIASHRRHEEGTVLLKVAVSAAGLPTAVSLERSCGYRLLDDAALETVRRWTFTPARAAGVAIPSVVVIPVRFAATQADR